VYRIDTGKIQIEYRLCLGNTEITGYKGYHARREKPGV
jgi:hypothetical protein